MPPEYYSSIDTLPVYNWRIIHDSGDLTYLLIKTKTLNKYQQLFLFNAWTKINDEYLKHFGITEAVKEIIEKEKYLICLNEDYVVNDNKAQLTFIEITELEIASLKKKLSEYKDDFHVTKAKLEKALNKDYIDTKKISVKEYFSYFKMLADGRE